MRTTIVFTLTGPDRVGIVEDVTAALVGLDCNVETSRMARLGGEFAMLMSVSMPEGMRDSLEHAFDHLAEAGYRVCLSGSEKAAVDAPANATPYRIGVSGADHEGIVHEIARGLSQAGINIESMETGTVPSPISGTPLFTMSALVAVPANMVEEDWTAALEDAGNQAGVDITVSKVDA